MKPTLLLSTIGLIVSTAAFAQNPSASYAQAVGGASTSVSRPDMGYQPAPVGQVQKHRAVMRSRATKPENQ